MASPYANLVSYDDKHNEANGKDNRHGTGDTGPGTAVPRAPPTTRAFSRCAPGSPGTMLTTLMLSFGVPLLLGGMRWARTEQGNNNAYCQDNEITWFDWDNADTALLQYADDLIDSGAPTRSSAASASSPAPSRRSCSGSPGGHADGQRRLGRPERPGHRRLPGRVR